MRPKTSAALAAALLLAGAGRARATTWHVAPDGDDGADGGERAPLATIQAAADRVAPGDEVLVHPGTYRSASSGFLIALDRGGSADAWVTFRSLVPGAAIIDGDHNHSSHCWVLLDGARYVRIEGFEVRGCLHSGFHSNAGAQHIEFVRNHVHDIGRLCTDTTSGKVAFYQGTGAAYHIYDGNLIHDIGRFGPGEEGCDPDTEYYENHDHGMYLNASHILVVNNVFSDLTHGWPIHIYGSASKQDIAIVNNTFAFPNPHRDGHVLLTAGTSGVVIANNIFHRPTAGAVAIGSCAGISEVAIHHNLTDEGEIVAGETCGFAIADNQVASDPRLVDPAGGDFRLEAGSPAIDRGAAIPQVPATDASGAPRPQGDGVDLGAFEVAVGGGDGGPAGDAGSGAGAGEDARHDGDGDRDRDDEGGGCSTGGGAPPALASGLLLLLLFAGRPRRRAGS